MPGAAERLRTEGRAEAVILIFVQLRERMPHMEVDDLARFARVSHDDVLRAMDRLRVQTRRRKEEERSARRKPPQRDPLACKRCGRSIPRSGHPGRPREICDACLPVKV